VTRLAPAVLWLGLAASPAAGQTYEIAFWTVDGGGTAPRTAGAFTLSGTAGQPDAGAIAAGGPYATTGGIWSVTFLPTSLPQADLSVTKTDGQATAVPGLPLTYTILVSNAGPAAATGASLVDVLAPELTGATWTCAASPGSSCPAGGTGSINAAVNLLAGGTATFSLTATVAPGATGTVGNRAIVSAPAGALDPVALNNSSADVDTLTPLADLSVALSDDVDPVVAGGPLTYALALGNAGPSTSAGMTAVGTLPLGVSFVSATSGCTHAAGVVTCVLGALPPANAASVEITVAVHPTTEGLIRFVATVTGDQTDPASANDTDQEETTVVRAVAGELAHGALVRGDLRGVGAGADRDDYRLWQEPYASYEVVLDETSGDIGAGQGPLLERIGPDGATVLQSSVAAGAGPARSLRWINTVTETVTDELVRVRSASCGSDCGADDGYRLRAYETTGRIARFNNSASQLTVVILQNRGGLPLSGQLHFWSASGALQHTEGFSMAGHAAFVLNTAGVPLLTGQSGAITITHDGRYDELAGKAVALEPATGFSFDSPLLTRSR
jgi:uncharacterized repeat protein (TIGR01451 family)